jgi:hypothetical protein
MDDLKDIRNNEFFIFKNGKNVFNTNKKCYNQAIENK